MRTTSLNKYLRATGAAPDVRWRLLLVGAVCAVVLSTGCTTAPPPGVQGLPPGAPSQSAVPLAALNPDVRQETIRSTICMSGYAASVRPSAAYTNGVKRKLLRDQGLPAQAATEYELDHRVPLALGGHPRNLENLALQPWTGEQGAKRKDVVEREMHRRVCFGGMPREDARRAMFAWPITR